MSIPKVTIDQWRALQAVVELGGYAQAAQHLHRSQSSVSYAIRRLEEQLGLNVLEVHGRKAELTDIGRRVLQRARELIRDAGELEELAQQVKSGWESRLRLVVDAAFPTALLMQALELFAPQSRGTQVELVEVIMSGADDLVEAGQADIVIGHQLPAANLGSEVIQIPFIAVAHHQHPLNNKGGNVNENDLRKQRQVIVRDSGHQPRDKGWLSTQQRWSVSSLDTSVTLIASNMGYAWLPYHKIEACLKQGIIQPIPLQHGQVYSVPLFLYFAHKTYAGPAAMILSTLLEECAARYQVDIKQYQ
jgi:DNA-binding transcriptional LysR family regulator